MQPMPGVAVMYAAPAHAGSQMSRTPIAIERDVKPLHPPDAHRSDDMAGVDQHERQPLGGMW